MLPFGFNHSRKDERLPAKGHPGTDIVLQVTGTGAARMHSLLLNGVKDLGTTLKGWHGLAMCGTAGVKTLLFRCLLKGMVAWQFLLTSSNRCAARAKGHQARWRALLRTQSRQLCLLCHALPCPTCSQCGALKRLSTPWCPSCSCFN